MSLTPYKGNAFKYTLEGCIIVKVEFDSRHAIFSVQDTGVGIPKHDLDRSDLRVLFSPRVHADECYLVFDRFHRVEVCCIFLNLKMIAFGSVPFRLHREVRRVPALAWP